MTERVTFLDDLLNYNDWANDKILQWCHPLSDELLDTSREMGFGTLRATVFHILAAEEIWQERWQAVPWRSFPTDPQGLPINEMQNRLHEISHTRRDFLHASGDLKQTVAYQDSKQTAYNHQLNDLVLHVINHGIHHRAQALNFLRHCGVSTGVGIDYIFFRMENSQCLQMPETQQLLNQYGLKSSDTPGRPLAINWNQVKRFFEYNNWANAQVLAMFATAGAAHWNRNFEMGFSTPAATLMHMFDVERWMLSVWDGNSCFGQKSPAMQLDELQTAWSELKTKREQVLSQLSDAAIDQTIELNMAGPIVKLQLAETIGQVLCHSTHHRAQLINMLRHCEAKPRNIDLLYALSDMTAPK